MSKLALGTVQFGLDYGVSNINGQVSEKEVTQILTHASAHNIQTLDTAAAYGTSEQVLGNYLSKNIQAFQLVTKLIPDSNQLIEQFHQSLDRLQTNRIYAVMLHNAEDLLSDQGKSYFQQLQQLKDSGKAEKIGVSVYNTEQFDQINALFDIDIVQVPMNIFDQRFCSDKFKQVVENKQIEVHARSLFLQGLLLMPEKSWPEYFRPFKEQLVELQDFVTQSQLTALEACLSFAKSQSHVDKFVVGVNSKKELEQIVQSDQNVSSMDFSHFAQTDQRLINPAKWLL